MNVSLAIGVAAAIGAALVGSVWQVATRFGVTTTLAPLDLAVLRYGVPALLLLPLLLRHGLWPASGPAWLFVPMLLGAGLPFGLLAMGGAAFAPVAHMGVLMAGTIPVFAGLLAAAVLGTRLTPARFVGFGVIAAGVALVAGKALLQRHDQAWIGDLLFLAAAFAWAVYTVAFQKSGLSPWHATALLAFASALGAVPLWAWSGGWDRMAAAPWRDLAAQTLAQGILAGVAGQWTFALAIRHLGPTRAALSGALVPALSALGGLAILGEWPGPAALGGAAAIALGIVVAGRQPGPTPLQAAAPGRASRPAAAD